MTAEEDLAALQKRRDVLERTRAEAQIRLEQETKALREALTELRTEFGVQNLTDAATLAERLEQDFRATIEQLDQELKEAGA